MSAVHISNKTIIKEIQNKNDLKIALKELSKIDSDFNGENGEKYLWDEARKNNFKTNADYLIDTILFHSDKNIENRGVEGYTTRFANEWMYMDNYYRSIVIQTAKLNGNANDPDIQGIYAFNILTICQ